MSVAQLALLPQSRGHLQQRRPMMTRVQITELQAPREIVRARGVSRALVRVLQPAEELRQADVHLKESPSANCQNGPVGREAPVEIYPCS